MQILDQTFRESSVYKAALKDALDTFPTMNQGLFDMALMAAWGTEEEKDLVIQLIKDDSQTPVTDGGHGGVERTCAVSETDSNPPSHQLSQVCDGDPESL